MGESVGRCVYACHRSHTHTIRTVHHTIHCTPYTLVHTCNLSHPLTHACTHTHTHTFTRTHMLTLTQTHTHTPQATSKAERMQRSQKVYSLWLESMYRRARTTPSAVQYGLDRPSYCNPAPWVGPLDTETGSESPKGPRYQRTFS